MKKATLLPALALASLPVLAQAPQTTHVPGVAAPLEVGATAHADALAPPTSPMADPYAGRDIAVAAYVTWRGTDTTYRSLTTYTSPKSTGDDIAYDFERTSFSPGRPPVVTSGEFRSLRDAASGQTYTREEATRTGSTFAYWGFVETLAPVSGRELTRTIRRPLDSLYEALPPQQVTFDSVTVRPGYYESYFGYGDDADTLATPSPLCPLRSTYHDTLVATADYTQSLSRWSIYDACEWSSESELVRSEYRDDDGALLRLVDSNAFYDVDPDRTGLDAIIVTRDYSRDGLTETVTETITYVTGDHRGEVTFETAHTYDAEGRLLTTDRPGYAVETASGDMAEYYGLEETYAYGPDHYEVTAVNTDLDDVAVTGTYTRVDYRPRASGLIDRVAGADCDLRAASTPTGLAVTAPEAGAYRALDFAGRAVWAATARAGETVTFRPGARGVYAVQGPRGCASVAVW